MCAIRSYGDLVFGLASAAAWRQIAETDFIA
jgi:hypothetical protein